MAFTRPTEVADATILHLVPRTNSFTPTTETSDLATKVTYSGGSVELSEQSTGDDGCRNTGWSGITKPIVGVSRNTGWSGITKPIVGVTVVFLFVLVVMATVRHRGRSQALLNASDCELQPPQPSSCSRVCNIKNCIAYALLQYIFSLAQSYGVIRFNNLIFARCCAPAVLQALSIWMCTHVTYIAAIGFRKHPILRRRGDESPSWHL